MPDAAKKTTDLIIGRGLITAEAIGQELRQRLLNRIMRQGLFALQFDQQSILQLARETLSEFEPILGAVLFDTEIAAWVSGLYSVSNRLPPWAENAIAGPISPEGFFIAPWQPAQVAPTPPIFGGGKKPPIIIKTLYPGDEEPIVRFPLIEKAAQSLADRGVVTRADFDRMGAEARAQSFTVARIDSTDTLERIRDTLAEVVKEGPSLKIFREKLEESIGASRLGPGHLENVYRTNVQTAYMQGHDDLASNPVVAEVFPYQEYLAIHDARARHDHLALEKLGLSGTGVYRREDPFWDIFTPPWGYQCRCGVNLLTVEAAARKGVAEAQEWLRTGIKPPLDSRLPHIPFRPADGFGQRPRLRAA